MKAVIATLLVIAVATFLIIAMIGRKDIVRHHKFIALFFLFYFIDNLVIALANRFPEVQLIPNYVWSGFLICSWSGKIYSFLIVLLLLHLFRQVLNGNEVGLSLQQSKGSLLPSAVIILMIAFWSSFVGSKSSQGVFDILTLLFGSHAGIERGARISRHLAGLFRQALSCELERGIRKDWLGHCDSNGHVRFATWLMARRVLQLACGSCLDPELSAVRLHLCMVERAHRELDHANDCPWHLGFFPFSSKDDLGLANVLIALYLKVLNFSDFN